MTPSILMLIFRCRYQMFFGHDFRNKVVRALALGWFGRGMDIVILELMDVASRFMTIPVAEGMATTRAVALGKRAEYMAHGVLDDRAGVRQARNVGYRVDEVVRVIKYSSKAGGQASHLNIK